MIKRINLSKLVLLIYELTWTFSVTKIQSLLFGQYFFVTKAGKSSVKTFDTKLRDKS